MLPALGKIVIGWNLLHRSIRNFIPVMLSVEMLFARNHVSGRKQYSRTVQLSLSPRYGTPSMFLLSKRMFKVTIIQISEGWRWLCVVHSLFTLEKLIIRIQRVSCKHWVGVYHFISNQVNVVLMMLRHTFFTFCHLKSGLRHIVWHLNCSNFS